MAVTHDVFTDNAKAGKAGRSNAKRPTNSAAICCASAALPPLPKSSSLFPLLMAASDTSLTRAIDEISTVSPSSLCLTAIDPSIDFAALCSKSAVWFMYLRDLGPGCVNQYNPRKFRQTDASVPMFAQTPLRPSLTFTPNKD